MCPDDSFFSLTFLLKSAVNPFLFFFLSFFLCFDPFFIADGRKFVYFPTRPRQRSSQMTVDRFVTQCLIYFTWMYDSSGRYFYPRQKNKKRKRKKSRHDTMRPSQHGSNKKSRADLIWGGERDRKETRSKAARDINQKRSKENLIGEEMNKIVLFRRINSIFSSRDSYGGNTKFQRELGILQML